MPEAIPGTTLVIDINGVRGISVARALLRAGASVRGWTHSRSSDAALLLAQQGVEIVEGSLDNADGLRLAMQNASAVVLSGSPLESGLPSEARAGERIIEAAHRSSIPFLLMISIAGADQHTGLPRFESKHAVEQHLRSSGLNHTILAPAFLMENLLTVNLLTQLRQGRLSLPLDSDRRLQVLAAHDLGAFAAMVLARPDEFQGQRLSLASDDVTGRLMAQSLSRRIGRPVDYQIRPIEQVRAWNPDYAQLFEWLNRIGFNADIEMLRNRWPEIGWRRFDTWTTEQNWPRLLGTYEAA